MAKRPTDPAVRVDFQNDHGCVVLQGDVGTPHLMLAALEILDAADALARKCGCAGCAVLRRRLPLVSRAISAMQDEAEAALYAAEGLTGSTPNGRA